MIVEAGAYELYYARWGAVSFPPLDFADPPDWLERGLHWVYVTPRCPRDVPADVAPALAAVRAELLASA